MRHIIKLKFDYSIFMQKIKLAYIIDDDPLYNFGMKKLMEITGFSAEVAFFLNGEEALNDLSKRNLEDAPLPDVILLDINMPIMNGWQFLDQCCELKAVQQSNIFVVSSSINKEEIDKAVSYPFVNDYILKPMTLDKIRDLKSKVEELI